MPRSGEVIDGRFTIEDLAGAGGMGQVYRTRDLRSGGLVALKVLHDAEQLEIDRFAREAQVLATLSHPGIVRYIGSGTTAEGGPYLVMEWLPGETLSARLRRTQITLAETLVLGRRVASALGAIHRRGVVHRDLKPSNLFLRDDAIDDAVLIDFGMARGASFDPKLTATGTMLGTPGYIAPEQVYNLPNLDARADVFSLGCVLYRCVSGQVPFRGHDALDLLLNGRPDELPRLRELQASVPPELDDLVARMLSKSPDDRPHNGDVVAVELAAIQERDPGLASVPAGPRRIVSELMVAERRLMSLVAVRHVAVRAEREPLERAFRAVAERHRGRLELLADGSLLVILSSTDAATDLASRAARCALAIRRLLGNGAMAIVTGREVLGTCLPETGLLDRAVALLESTPRGAAIRIDELTSALLDHRFDTGSTTLHLRGELRDPERIRLVSGEPAALVGRDQELAQLDTIFGQCADEHVASVVLLTGPPGAGKSRLGDELLRRLEARAQPPEIWFGRADALSAGSPLGLLAQLLRRVFGLSDDDSIEVRRDKIRSWAARRPDPDVGRAAELLGTLFEGEDPVSAGPIGRAFLSLVRAACAARPVVLVLEDLHWGDLPTIKVVDAVLGALSDQPLMVVALARTELHEIVPQLWAERRVQEIRLRKLTRRASEQLVRQVLGDEVESETLRSLVEHSEGHASYLEALIRAVAGGRTTETPPTVLAMVQAQIEKLDPEARRVLRAASIFGETFWRGGVEALLGGGTTAAWLGALVEQDVVAVNDGGRFPAEAELRFRHALVQEAAYGMLTDGDRVRGHWLAGQWLGQAGETDPAILGKHFEQRGGGEPGTPV